MTYRSSASPLPGSPYATAHVASDERWYANDLERREQLADARHERLHRNGKHWRRAAERLVVELSLIIVLDELSAVAA